MCCARCVTSRAEDRWWFSWLKEGLDVHAHLRRQTATKEGDRQFSTSSLTAAWRVRIDSERPTGPHDQPARESRLVPTYDEWYNTTWMASICLLEACSRPARKRFGFPGEIAGRLRICHKSRFARLGQKGGDSPEKPAPSARSRQGSTASGRIANRNSAARGQSRSRPSSAIHDPSTDADRPGASG